MKLVYTLFILQLYTLAARAESRVSDSVACAPTSVMLANDTVAKQKALGKEYKLTAIGRSTSASRRQAIVCWALALA